MKKRILSLPNSSLNLVLSLLVLISMSTVMASGSHQGHGGHDHDGNNHRSHTKIDRKVALSLLELNESLRTAFLNGNSKHLNMTVKKISKVISSIKNGGMRKMLMMSKIGALNSNTDEKHTSHIYAEFSKHLTHLIKMHNLGATYKEYYCPMAKKSWVQNISKSKKVQNPYLKNMRSCGSIKS